jgi:ABC-type multidrug transport system ATPase subunit
VVPAIVLRGVRKTFGLTTAVENLDLVIPRGALYGFIGPNGAGKTTSIRMIMSILFPDSGEISILGHASALEAKDRIGYLPEERGVYRKSSAFSSIRRTSRSGARIRFWRVLRKTFARLQRRYLCPSPVSIWSNGLQTRTFSRKKRG